ncbi:MAG: phosphoenolpyruvate mutase [Verrucomicrobiales bacterium]|nr:phosphoenolpyruvate mutase [Verrucomicrobiales bacterium]
MKQDCLQPSAAPKRKTTQFRNLLHSGELEFVMEAHSGLSARIAEEAGFHAVWASGLSISAALGVRDSNEASWTQVLDIVEYMADATTVPILLDGDTGYGNFNNARRLVRKLEQRGVAAVCMEDKIFPKTNSFLKGSTQRLADKEEFTGKIKAAKDSQLDSDFSVVARLEGFIANHSLEEMLDRADSYASAGADALLIHSKQDTADEIASFVAHWNHECPIVIVPTTYADTPTSEFRKMGISMAIWANHSLRSTIPAMQNVCRQIFEEQSIANLNGHVAPLSEVFRLQDTDELAEAEKRYLPSNPVSHSAPTNDLRKNLKLVMPAKTEPSAPVIQAR